MTRLPAIARILSAIVALAIIVGLVVPTSGTVRASGGIPAFDHVFIIALENHALKVVQGNPNAPFLSEFAEQHELAVNFHGVAHPSLPNYLAVTTGSTQGVTTDCTTTCLLDIGQAHLWGRVSRSGRTWAAAMQTMPAACFMGSSSGLYAMKHNPAMYPLIIRSDPGCQRQVVPLSQLGAMLASESTTPNLVWISPDQCFDMHSCTVSKSDQFMQSTLIPQILSSPAWQTANSMLAIWWDENDGSQANNLVPLIIAQSRSDLEQPGLNVATHYDHYSLLRTIEDAWGLDPITANDAAAAPMSDFFQPAALPTVLPTVEPTATNTPVPTPDPNGVVVGQTVWNTDVHAGTISVTVPATGDPNQNAMGSVRYWLAGSGAWTDFVPIGRTADGFAGTLNVGCTPLPNLDGCDQQSVQTEVLVVDPDGVSVSPDVAGNVSGGTNYALFVTLQFASPTDATPTPAPTAIPTSTPTVAPTSTPTPTPTVTSTPTVAPTDTPTPVPPTATPLPPTATPLPEPAVLAPAGLLHQTFVQAGNDPSVHVDIAPTTAGDMLVVIVNIQPAPNVRVGAIHDSSGAVWSNNSPQHTSTQNADSRTEVWWRPNVTDGLTGLDMFSARGAPVPASWSVIVQELAQ